MSRKEFVIILSITFAVFMAWIVFDILHSKPSVEVNPKINDLLTPIDPVFDQETFKQVNTNIQGLSQAPILVPEPTPAPTPQPSSQPQTTPLPSSPDTSASDSATLNSDINSLGQ